MMTQTVTITPRDTEASPDEYNDDTYTDGTPVETVGWMHQTQRSESTAAGQVDEQTWALYLPPDTIVKSLDKVAVDGDDFEVIGPPWPANNPRLHRVTHIEATLRRVS